MCNPLEHLSRATNKGGSEGRGESSSAELNELSELSELKLEISGKILSLQSFDHELRHIESFAI